MTSPKSAPINDNGISNMTGDYGDDTGEGYVRVRANSTADIKLGYPITAGELSYQIEVAIWQAGRGPHPDRNQKSWEIE